jgi:hypothetical protein
MFSISLCIHGTGRAADISRTLAPTSSQSLSSLGTSLVTANPNPTNSSMAVPLSGSRWMWELYFYLMLPPHFYLVPIALCKLFLVLFGCSLADCRVPCFLTHWNHLWIVTWAWPPGRTYFKHVRFNWISRSRPECTWWIGDIKFCVRIDSSSRYCSVSRRNRVKIAISDCQAIYSFWRQQ